MESIIIPARNEALGLPLVLKNLRTTWNGEVIVVDNGSTDATYRVAKGGGARVLFLETPGKGRSMRFAAKQARGDILVFVDGDNTYPVDLASHLVSIIRENSCDCVFGSRFLPGAEREMSLKRQAGNYLLNRLSLWKVRHQRTDILSGFFAIRKDVFQELGLVSNGFEIEAEIFLKLEKMGKCTMEIPVPYRGRSNSQLRPWIDGLKITYTLIRGV
ncbi:MAG: glycosyltransferase family 2 protein [Patescibacteria group bacterium]